MNYILFGSSSELADSFSKEISNENIYYISRHPTSYSENNLIIEDYLENLNEIIEFCKNVEDPIIIFFNGYLNENRPLYTPNYEEVVNTFKINYLIPFEITKRIKENNLKIKKFVYVSSFAAVKLRYKNFNYGSSKKLLEESINSLELENFLILRFGKINTKMSKNHSSSIFDLDKDKAAQVLLKNIKTKTGIKYPNLTTKLLSVIISLTPNFFIKKFQL